MKGKKNWSWDSLWAYICSILYFLNNLLPKSELKFEKAYDPVIVSAVQNFKDFDFNTIYFVINAPGNCIYDRVEWKIAPLVSNSQVLYWNMIISFHVLICSNRTTDLKLEKVSFESVGIILANMESQFVFDDFPVIAQYIMPIDTRLEIL